jgi:ankyrin repeat protein
MSAQDFPKLRYIKSIDIVRLVDPSIIDKEGLLIHGVIKNNLEIVEYCLEQGVDPNTLSGMDRPIYLHACAYGYVDIVKLFIKHGVNCPNALNVARKNEQWDVVEFLSTGKVLTNEEALEKVLNMFNESISDWSIDSLKDYLYKND